MKTLLKLMLKTESNDHQGPALKKKKKKPGPFPLNTEKISDVIG